jgi:hypothetical protein
MGELNLLLSLLSKMKMTGVIVEGFYQSILGWIPCEAACFAHCLSTEGFPHAHNLPQEGFGIQPWRLLWGPHDDISDMKRTLGPVR